MELLDDLHWLSGITVTVSGIIHDKNGLLNTKRSH